MSLQPVTNTESFVWSDKRVRTALPIDQRLREILSLLKEHRVLVCEAETGAGKTTRIGQAAVLNDPRLKVIMTQTRRAACRWNGSRITEELGCKPGQLVGWSLAGEGDRKVSKETRLELIVDQTLINRIRFKGKLPKGLIIVDEAHERSLSIDLLLGLIHTSLSSSPHSQILIMSATIDTQKFSAFFGNAPIMHVEGRCFPVSTEVISLRMDEHHTAGAERATCMVIERFLSGNLLVADGTTVKRGSVIVLLPGKEDIDAVMQGLLKKIHHARIQLSACHGQSSAADQELVQSEIPAETLRVICGTEVLRSSVTIRETVGVIDSLQIKRRITDAKGVGHLTKIAISKAEANQAKGRAGRTAPGFYIPISFQGEFEILTEFPLPAIHREPIGKIALEVANLGHSVRTFKFIDPPPQEQIELAIRRLKDLGALHKDETITELGKKLLRYPLDPEQAKVLLTAQELEVLPEALIVIAFLEVEEFLFRVQTDRTLLIDKPWLEEILKGTDYTINKLPPWINRKNNALWELHCGHNLFPHAVEGAKWAVKQQHMLWAGTSQNDFVLLVNAYRAFKKIETKRLNDRVLDKWCADRGFKLKALRLVDDKTRQILEEFSVALDCTMDRQFNPIALVKALISGKIDHIAKSNGKLFVGNLGSFKLVKESVCPNNSSLIIMGGVRKVATKRRGEQELLLADLAAPLKMEWLCESAPHLYALKRYGEVYYDEKQDQVVESATLYFKEQPLHRGTVAVDDVTASSTFAKWLCGAFSNKTLAANRQREEQARKLNQRAGELLFKTFSLEELREYYLKKLKGAKSFREIKDPTVLALPPLDLDLIQRVQEENPDFILLKGQQFAVKYTDLPRIYLDEWEPLGTEPVKLPGGREVEVFIHLRKLQWNRQGQLDLSGWDLSHEDLSKVALAHIIFDRRTIFPLKTPCLFLSEEELNQTEAFKAAVQRLITYNHPQQGYILRCIAIQAGLERLFALAPERCSRLRHKEFHYDLSRNQVIQLEIVTFCHQQVQENWVEVDEVHASEGLAEFLCTQALSPEHRFFPVQSANVSLIKDTVQLNLRAGQPLFDLPKLKTFYLEKLTGFKSLKEIVDPQILALPRLNQGLVARVHRENPISIYVDEEAFPIEYGSKPRIHLTTSLKKCLKLFAQPVKLPGGRLIEVFFNDTLMRWNSKGRADLSGWNLSKEDLTDVDLSGMNLSTTFDKTTCFPVLNAKNPQASLLPLFLTEEELFNEDKLQRALDRIDTLSHPQVEEISWCIAKQLVAHPQVTPAHLKKLHTHSLVSPRGFLNALASIFSKPEETEIQKFLSKAMLSLIK